MRVGGGHGGSWDKTSGHSNKPCTTGGCDPYMKDEGCGLLYFSMYSTKSCAVMADFCCSLVVTGSVSMDGYRLQICESLVVVID